MNPAQQPTRRLFLQTSGAALAGLALSPWPALGDEGAPAAAGKVLVVVFLRGGADGLSLVAPYGDARYRALRPTLAVPPPGAEGGAVDLDGAFGLHPRLAALGPLFAEGQAACVHAVGRPGNTRSHFEEQDVWETARLDGAVDAEGWVNRYLQAVPREGFLRAVAVGDSLPRMLQGEVSALAIRSLEDLRLGEGAAAGAALADAYGAGGAGARGLVGRTGEATLAGAAEVARALAAARASEVEYPDTPLARRLALVARLIHADLGVEVAEVDAPGWDTHQNQAVGLGNNAQALGDALAAFVRDLGPRRDDVLVLTLSDFGRTAAENGTRGTDHGWGNRLLAFGGPVARARAAGAGPLVGAWPGLGEDALEQGRDLRHTTDFRDVLGEALRVHLGCDPAGVIPGRAFELVGLLA